MKFTFSKVYFFRIIFAVICFIGFEVNASQSDSDVRILGPEELDMYFMDGNELGIFGFKWDLDEFLIVTHTQWSGKQGDFWKKPSKQKPMVSISNKNEKKRLHLISKLSDRLTEEKVISILKKKRLTRLKYGSTYTLVSANDNSFQLHNVYTPYTYNRVRNNIFVYDPLGLRIFEVAFEEKEPKYGFLPYSAGGKKEILYKVLLTKDVIIKEPKDQEETNFRFIRGKLDTDNWIKLITKLSAIFLPILAIYLLYWNRALLILKPLSWIRKRIVQIKSYIKRPIGFLSVRFGDAKKSTLSRVNAYRKAKHESDIRKKAEEVTIAEVVKKEIRSQGGDESIDGIKRKIVEAIESGDDERAKFLTDLAEKMKKL